MREQAAYGMVIAALVLLTVLYPSAGFAVRQLFFSQSNADRAYQELERRLQVLEAERATNASLPSAAIGAESPGIAAFVFSRYPFNFRHELLINEGTAAGIAAGDVALAPLAAPLDGGAPREGIFLGKVKAVYETSASIETIFNPSFESAVRIGKAGIDALLVGGTDPKATLIPRRADVKEGDIVYAAAPDIPYGIAIGEVARLAPSRDNIFMEATLTFAYDVNRVTVVRVVPSKR